ncbi:MAG: SNF2-related protein [Chthoniobacteraceae bacterium]
MVELTEKLLMDAGGWQAMKEARSLYEAGKVIEAAYAPPALTGRVRAGELEYRAGLLVKSRTDIENTCTCAESRRRGLICAHSLAVGVAVIRGMRNVDAAASDAAKGGVVVAITGAKAEAHAAEDANFSTTADGTEVALHVILPPNFAAAWEKKSVMIVCEVEIAGQRRPLGSLPADARHRVSDADAALVKQLRARAGGKLPAVVMATREQFAALLEVLAGHPRVTFGKTRAVRIEAEGPREALRVERMEDGGLRVSSVAGAGDLLLAMHSAWRLADATFTHVAPGLPAAYLPVLAQAVTVPAANADGFLARELPVLAEFFEIEGDAVPGAPAELPVPEFAAHFEGSLNFLTARVEAIYGERRVTLDVTGAALAMFARNRASEQAALERLRACGFSGPDGKGELILKGEQRILAFFAAALPRLKREWKVTIGERFGHVTREVERIEPRLEIRSSGEQWFDLSYELGTASGERFSGADIARLLQGGQSHMRRKNGKLAVFDPAILDEFEQLLRDSDPRQTQAGVYRLDRRQAGALDGFIEENRVAVGGEMRWREWAGTARNLDRLTPVPLGSLETVLRDYQKHGVYWLNFLAKNGFGGILADEMGLGKTVQTLAFLRTLAGQGSSLVVCPSSLIFNWRAEAAKWTPELRVLAIEGPQRAEDFRKIAESDLVITSYPLLRRDAAAYEGMQFATVILDEAQHIKNPDSQNAHAASSLQSRHRFVLTGTPIENSVRDIWSLMNFLMPRYLGTRAEFRERYESAIQGDAGGREQQRLTRRIRPFLLRRTKKSVAKEIPDKLEQIAYCELSVTQRQVYMELAAGTRQQLFDLAGEKDRNQARMVMLTALLRLRQAACDLRLLGLESPPSEAEASAKLNLLEELLSEALDGGHRVLVFSQFVTMLGFIRRRLDSLGIAYCYLDGQTRERGAEVGRFQAGGMPIFLISLKAGGTGLNLSAADTVVHFDPWWNPAVEAQATDRAHRIGQKKVVTSYKLIARGTVEEKIVSLQAKKRAITAATLDSEQPLMEGLSMDDIRELLE